jgi:hypothetical protein
MEAQTLSDENLYILREQALNALRDGDRSVLDEGLADGTITKAQAHTIRERAKLTPIQDAVHGFRYDKLMRVYDAADDDEKDELQPIVNKKYRSLLREHKVDELAAAEP